ncbi:MAG: isoprenylcysteine carboxylmethyltransferase family protein [Candidatus Dormibacteraeota bacterium]|nr:isoprenylcysteine carboxylmethyltransferase family protein [Candidatus Dormibacteraeota bacterium]
MDRDVMAAVDLVFLVGWIVFWVLWLAAGFTAKSTVTWNRDHVGFRLLIAVVVVLLLRSNVFNLRSGVVTDPLLQGMGIAVFVLGLAGAAWARVYLGRNWGMPMTERADPELITSGPYRYVRHPIYTAIIVAMVGTAIGVGLFWLVPAVAAAAYFIYSAGVEEKTMSRRFPDAYPAYKRNTKMLIPFLL